MYNYGILKAVNLLHNTSNQPSKYRTKNWVEIKVDEHGTNNTNSQIKFKTSVLKSSLCDYSDVYIFVKGIISDKNTSSTGADANN